MSLTALRLERLSRLQSTMKAQGIGAVLLTNPVNVRYATGVAIMPLWTSVNLARYAFVPASGEPILCDYPAALFRAKAVWRKSRPAIYWQQRFSQHEVDNRCKEWAGSLENLFLEHAERDFLFAVDCLDLPGFQALTRTDLRLCDSDPLMQEARRIKSPLELEWIRKNCQIGENALAALEQAIVPGASEEELLAAFWGAALKQGAEYCSTRLINAGAHTNPWFQEANYLRVAEGDVVGIDTDLIGVEGYLYDVSRTFLCGDSAGEEEKDAYKYSKEFIESVFELCRPGVEHVEILEKAPRIPEKYIAQAYPCMIHGCGMDDEPPFIPYREQIGSLVPKGHLEPNMVLSIEFYAGRVGGRQGVKLEDQILVTETGPQFLSRYPYEQRLLK